MLSRRHAILSCVSALALPQTSAYAQWYKTLVDTFVELCKTAGPALDEIFNALLRVKRRLNVLLHSKEAAEDIRRKLVNPNDTDSVRTKLGGWVERYDRFVADKRAPDESERDYNLRHERERALLSDEWKRCRTEAVAALKEIDTLGAELESIDSTAIPAPEWQKYKAILRESRDLIQLADVEMPTDPLIVERIREAARGARRVIEVIDRRMPELNEAIRRAG